MTLRGDPDFEDISLTKNPKMPPPRKRKRPAGEKVIRARTWKPLVFTNKVVRQNPSKTLEVSKGYQDGKKRIVGRSIAVQTDLGNLGYREDQENFHQIVSTEKLGRIHP